MRAFASLILAGFLLWPSSPAAAQYVSHHPACSVESTGLKYTTIEGSGLASMFFVIPLLALAPVAGLTDTTGQYGCHVVIVGGNALGARQKIANRPKVTPY